MKKLLFLIIPLIIFGFFFAEKAEAAGFLIYYDSFSTEKGWTGYGGSAGWRPLPMSNYTGQCFKPGVGCESIIVLNTDHSLSDDDYALGTSIGSCYDNDGCYGNNINLSNSWVISPVIDCSEYTSVELTYYICAGIKWGDSAYIGYKKIDGTWHEASILSGFSGPCNQWTKKTVNVSSRAAGNPSFQIKFGLQTDSSGVESGLHIDDVKITGLKPGYPILESVEDNPDPQTQGLAIDFTSVASDPDGDDMKLYICQDSQCTNCGPGDHSGCWTYSSSWLPNNPLAVYACPLAGFYKNSYWAKVCDTDDNCSAILNGGEHPLTQVFTPTNYDGYINKYGTDYNAVHNSAEGNVEDDTGSIYIGQRFTPYNGTYYIYRGFLDFDTSEIENNYETIEAELSLYLSNKHTEGGEFDLTVVEGSQDLPLQSNDYGDHLNMTTSGGSVNTSAISNRFEIPLNETGMSWINKTGTTKFCLRSSKDIGDIVPTGREYIYLYSEDVTYGGNKLIASFASPVDTFSCGIPCEEDTHNVWGWAWSENIGWASFSCKNCDQDNDDLIDPGDCGGSGLAIAGDYGVNIDETTGKFSGQAWSENIGWIDFSPAGPYPTAPNYSACVDLPVVIGEDCDGVGVGEVSGWARACSVFDTGCSGALKSNLKRGGWDGWIKLRDTNYGVWVDSSFTPSEFRDWAWGGNDISTEAVVGWLSFSHLNCDPDGDGFSNGLGACPPAPIPISDYKVMTSLSFNQAPSANNLSVDPDNSSDYCGVVAYPPVRVRWQFDDPDDSQSAFQIQIDTDSGFSPPLIVDTGKLPDDCAGDCGEYVFQNPGEQLSWGSTYYWRLKIWDSQDNPSADWIVYQDNISPPESFLTINHAYPNPDFTWFPEEPPQGETTQFCSMYEEEACGTPPCPIICPERTDCYDNNNNPIPCSGGIFTWTMPGAEGTDYEFVDGTDENSQNPKVKFLTNGGDVSLDIIDSAGYGPCSQAHSVGVKPPLPEWIEVEPI